MPQSGGEPKDSKDSVSTVKARELLSGAEVAVGSAEQTVQIAAAIGLADAFRAFDAKKSLDMLRNAFDAAAVLTGERGARQRVQFQVDIVRQVADLNLAEARSMLAAISASDSKEYDPRVWAAYRLVELHLKKNEFDEAIETVNSLHGAFPHGAAGLILAKLPEGDPRRVTVFGDAAVAYNARPDRAFIHLLARHWRSVPRRMAESALDTALKRTLESKEERLEMTAISTEKETVSLRTAQDADLFELLPVVRALAPARTEEILSDHRELRAMLQAHPAGSQSVKGTNQMMIKVGGRRGSEAPGMAQQARTGASIDDAARSMQQSAAAMAALKTDPQAALAAAQAIPRPDLRARMLATIASSISAKNPEMGRSALGESLAMTAGLKEPSERIGAWDSIAGAAHAAGDDKLAADVIEKGMADAAALYRKDTDRDNPTTLPRHQWPSTEAFLRIIRRATKLFGPGAEPLLLKINDPDLNLLARIEMARVLLGRPEQSR